MATPAVCGTGDYSVARLLGAYLEAYGVGTIGSPANLTAIATLSDLVWCVGTEILNFSGICVPT